MEVHNSAVLERNKIDFAECLEQIMQLSAALLQAGALLLAAVRM